MDTATEKPTPRQRALLPKLMLSSTFTAEEAHRTAVWLASPGATKERASEVIDDALARIKKPATMRKRPVPTAGPSITPTRTMAMANIPPGDTRKNPPQWQTGQQNPEPELPPERCASSCTSSRSPNRSRKSIGSMAWTTPTRMKPPPPHQRRSSANRQQPTRQAISKHLAHTTHRRNKRCI